MDDNGAADIEAADREAHFDLDQPASALKFFEFRAALETLLLLPSAPLLAARRSGDGRQIMVVPGFLTDDGVTWPLRRYLDYLGYRTQGWNLGRNKGFPERDAQRIAESLDDLRDPDRKITMIGWSLGGVVAREVARQRPDAVREVITIGTPVEGGPKYTIAGERFAASQGVDLDSFEAHVHEINQQGITQPLTVIYSRSDGVVGWRAAVDRYNPHARHVRVIGSHIGLGTNPAVWRIIEKTLRNS
ncbi:MAG: esterase/lipase family protein [Gammaproteobacteria bacterium]